MEVVKIKNSPRTTGWVIAGLGTLVSLAGYRMLPRKFGSGLLGFGAAHIILGLLDRLRPVYRNS